jgi:hypothetical protein
VHLTVEVFVSDRKRYLSFVNGSLVTAGVAVAALVPPAGAGAATAPPTPESLTTCTGHWSSDSSGKTQDEPYLIDYAFGCDTDISAYTLIVDRGAGQDETIDDFSPTASVILPYGAPSTTETVACEGTTPSDATNCNAGAGGVVTANYSIQGSVDPIAAACKHLPAKGRPGTPAIPEAIVQVVVTDNTGAEDGPFDLRPAPGTCKRVPNTVPQAKRHKAKKQRGKRGSKARAR